MFDLNFWWSQKHMKLSSKETELYLSYPHSNDIYKSQNVRVQKNVP